MRNKTEVVYVGQRGSVEVAWHRSTFVFKNRVPRKVPEDFANQLVRQDNYVLAEDLNRTILERLPGGGLVMLRRGGAIGDLLMLRAVVSAFIREHPTYSFMLRCDERFSGLFSNDPIWASVRAKGSTAQVRAGDAQIWGIVQALNGDRPELNFSLEQVAEQDHHGTEEHRSDLFAKAMVGTKLPIVPEDWALPTPAEVKAYVGRWLQRYHIERPARTRRLIAVQVRGSGLMKSIPLNQVRKLVAGLAEVADVALVEYDDRVTWSAEHVFPMTGRDALHSIELLRHVDLTVCFDSGVLWMAHCAASPVLCIMGPTRPEQRLTYHPLYAAGGAKAVLLNDRIRLKRDGPIGCKPCFEAAAACNGRFSCMQQQPDDVVEVIRTEALAMLGLQVALPVVSAS